MRGAERVLTISATQDGSVILQDWNPVARWLEPPACEFIASTERRCLQCDDALHLPVPTGLGPYPACEGGAFYRACHPERCPKCGAVEPLRHGVPST